MLDALGFIGSGGPALLGAHLWCWRGRTGDGGHRCFGEFVAASAILLRGGLVVPFAIAVVVKI